MRQGSRVGNTGNKGARHLAPVELRGGASTIGPCLNKQGARCSNQGFLPISTAEYLTLLDWTARQTRSGKRGSTPKQFAPLFDRLGISADSMGAQRSSRRWKTLCPRAAALKYKRDSFRLVGNRNLAFFMPFDTNILCPRWSPSALVSTSLSGFPAGGRLFEAIRITAS